MEDRTGRVARSIHRRTTRIECRCSRRRHRISLRKPSILSPRAITPVCRLELQLIVRYPDPRLHRVARAILPHWKGKPRYETSCSRAVDLCGHQTRYSPRNAGSIQRVTKELNRGKPFAELCHTFRSRRSHGRGHFWSDSFRNTQAYRERR